MSGDITPLFVFIGMAALVGVFIVALGLGDYLQKAGTARITEAGARLQEAKNAARQSPSPPHGGDHA